MYVDKIRLFCGCSLMQYHQMDPSALVEDKLEDLDSLLPENVETFISSSKSLLENVQQLQGVLELIPVPEDAWEMLEGVIRTLGDVSLNIVKASFISHSRRFIRLLRLH